MKCHLNILYFVPALALVAGCSLQSPDFTQCVSNSDCVMSFGVGSPCAADGYCEPATIHPRCTEAYPSDLLTNPTAYTDAIVLGTLFASDTQLDTRASAELAVAQANSNGGLDGRNFAMVHCDYSGLPGDGLTTIEAVEAVSVFLEEQYDVPVIVGPRGSGNTQAAYNVLLGTETVVFSPSATSPALTALDGVGHTDEAPGFLWRTAPPDSLQGRVIAADMTLRGIDSVSVIYQAGAYGEGLQEVFSDNFDGSIALFPYSDISGLGETLSNVQVAANEEVLFISSKIIDVIAFLDGAAATDSLLSYYAGASLFLTDTARAEILLTTTTSRGQGLLPNVRGSRPTAATGPLYDSFAASLRVEYGIDAGNSGFTAHSYDAAWLSIYGVAWSFHQRGTIDGLGVAQGLRQVSSGEEVEIRPSGWPAVNTAFREGRSVNVRGASGILDFDPSTEETTAPIEVWAVENGAFVSLTTIDP